MITGAPAGRGIGPRDSNPKRAYHASFAGFVLSNRSGSHHCRSVRALTPTTHCRGPHPCGACACRCTPGAGAAGSDAPSPRSSEPAERGNLVPNAFTTAGRDLSRAIGRVLQSSTSCHRATAFPESTISTRCAGFPSSPSAASGGTPRCRRARRFVDRQRGGVRWKGCPARMRVRLLQLGPRQPVCRRCGSDGSSRLPR